MNHSDIACPERYLDLWRSHNRLRTLSTPEQFAAFMQELTDYLASRGDEPIEVSYLCKAWTARRRDEGWGMRDEKNGQSPTTLLNKLLHLFARVDGDLAGVF